MGLTARTVPFKAFTKTTPSHLIKRLQTNYQNLTLDATKTYHIGTGQSSDSLMWGNRSGVLDALFAFARKPS